MVFTYGVTIRLNIVRGRWLSLSPIAAYPVDFPAANPKPRTTATFAIDPDERAIAHPLRIRQSRAARGFAQQDTPLEPMRMSKHGHNGWTGLRIDALTTRHE